jgi:hypothetical protein
LEYHLGITSEEERLRIIGEWKSDEEGWWDVIGPGRATYGDVLNGTRLVLDKPTSTIQGTFSYDSEHDTFYFLGEETFLEMPGEMGYGYLDQHFNSLTEFYETASDIIWLRPADNGELVYQGGTGYAADGAHISWIDVRDAIGSSAVALTSGVAGVGFLATPSPDPITKGLGLAGLTVCVISAGKANVHAAGFYRSVNASYRLNFGIEQ